MSRVIEKAVMGRAILEYDALSKKSTEDTEVMAVCRYNRQQGIRCTQCFLKPKLPWEVNGHGMCTINREGGYSELYLPIACKEIKEAHAPEFLEETAGRMRETLIMIYKEHYSNVDMG